MKEGLGGTLLFREGAVELSAPFEPPTTDKEESSRPLILLIEDNAADVRMVVEGLKTTARNVQLKVTPDGDEAIRFLRRVGAYESARRPDLILLDLRLPKKSGFEVLREIKGDSTILEIPVVVHTSSEAEMDIQKAYALHANSYVHKSAQFDGLTRTMQALVDFWLVVAKLPPGPTVRGSSD